MTRDEAQGLVAKILLDKVRLDPYPSRNHLALIEQSLPVAMAPAYLEVLMEKVTQDRFPSADILSRMQRIAQLCVS
ncbi:MAG TPA: hypothetical protein VGH99_00820 [Pseudonocardia sp.]|jgi:hypothetical protein